MDLYVIELPTNEKTLAPGIFDHMHPEYGQEEFSRIYSDNASEAVENEN